CGLVDRPFRVQLGGDVGAADQMRDHLGLTERFGQLSPGNLTRTHHDRVHLEHPRGAVVETHMQARVVDTLVARAGDHVHVFAAQRGAVHPAGGCAEPGADLAGFALHQVQRAWRGGDGALFTVHAAAGVRRVDDTPLGAPLVRVQSGAGFVAEELADVDTDAARADHRDTLTHRRAPENVHIGHHVRVVDPRNVGHTWADTGRDDHGVEGLRALPRFDAGVQSRLATEQFQLAGVVTDRFGELFLPGSLFREVALAADLGFRFVEHHLVSPAGDRRGRSQA